MDEIRKFKLMGLISSISTPVMANKRVDVNHSFEDFLEIGKSSHNFLILKGLHKGKLIWPTLDFYPVVPCTSKFNLV